jgi:hypothetical protein
MISLACQKKFSFEFSYKFIILLVLQNQKKMNTIRDTIRNYNNKNKKTLKSLLPHRCCNKSCVQHWTLEDSEKNTFKYLPGVSEECLMCKSRVQYYYEGKWRQHSSYKIVKGFVQRKKANTPKKTLPPVKNHVGVKRKRSETSVGSFKKFSNVSEFISKDSKQIGTIDIMDDEEYLQYLKNDEDIPEPKLQKKLDAVCKIEENLSPENNTISNLVETCELMFTLEDYIVLLKNN